MKLDASFPKGSTQSLPWNLWLSPECDHTIGCIDSKQPTVEELSFKESEQMSDEKSEKLLEIEAWQK